MKKVLCLAVCLIGIIFFTKAQTPDLPEGEVLYTYEVSKNLYVVVIKGPDGNVQEFEVSDLLKAVTEKPNWRSATLDGKGSDVMDEKMEIAIENVERAD
ncbi:hypothetical protein [Marinoscillum sp. MHG1-6]|uniref:hypothetical protein n=1 Tax=Marinoscillum sp. MHG1-6 TaxID=2959627 RepID=UPI00215802B9|nr:hypothetical protein [Marinoscillum sp. MHG1-6]